jgi:transposase
MKEGNMNPVVGIDVSKGESEGFIYLGRNKPWGKSFRFQHNYGGIENLFIF